MVQIEDNYFQLFNLPESYELDLDDLSRQYRDMQAEVHPDRFASAEEAERLRAVQLTSYLNQAYTTLASPLKRAAYLLQLRGHDLEQVSQSDLPMELLLEQMQLRESLDELPRDESALKTLANMKQDVKARLAARQEDFSRQLQADEIEQARAVFHELQFLEKLLSEIDSGEEQRLGY